MNFPERCQAEGCNNPINDKNSLYHIGTHLYVCGFNCYKHTTEVLTSTFCPKADLTPTNK